ncbi:MAG: hypothetical protein ABW039_06395 [Sphingobium sp.]
MKRGDAYRAAVEEARIRRGLFLDSLSQTRARIAPGRLGDDLKGAIVQKVQDAGTGVVNAVRDRPWATAAGATAFVAYLARRPIGSLLHRLYVRARTGEWENDNG